MVHILYFGFNGVINGATLDTYFVVVGAFTALSFYFCILYIFVETCIFLPEMCAFLFQRIYIITCGPKQFLHFRSSF